MEWKEGSNIFKEIVKWYKLRADEEWDARVLEHYCIKGVSWSWTEVNGVEKVHVKYKISTCKNIAHKCMATKMQVQFIQFQIKVH